MSPGMKMNCFVHHSGSAAAALCESKSELQKKFSSAFEAQPTKKLLMNRRVSDFSS